MENIKLYFRKGSGREILFEQRKSRQNPKEDGAVIYRGRPNMPYEKGERTLRYERYDKECPALTQNCAAGDQMNMVAIPNSNGNVHSLDANYWKGSNNPNKSRRSQVIVHNLQPRSPNRPSLLKNKNAGGSGHLQREDGITYTVDTGCTQGVAIRVQGDFPRKVYTSNEVGALASNPTSDNTARVIEDMRIRRLTPVETERLMGIPDGWTAKGIIDGKEVDISDTQRYKMCGNGVVVNCVDYIYNLISKTL